MLFVFGGCATLKLTILILLTKENDKQRWHELLCSIYVSQSVLYEQRVTVVRVLFG